MSPHATNPALLMTRRLTAGVLAAAALGVAGVSIHLAGAQARTTQQAGVAAGGTSDQPDSVTSDGSGGSVGPDGSDGFAPVQAPQGQQPGGGQQGSGQQGGGASGSTTTHGS